MSPLHTYSLSSESVQLPPIQARPVLTLSEENLRLAAVS